MFTVNILFPSLNFLDLSVYCFPISGLSIYWYHFPLQPVGWEPNDDETWMKLKDFHKLAIFFGISTAIKQTERETRFVGQA